jgi:CheY-like chemotaxis protein
MSSSQDSQAPVVVLLAEDETLVRMVAAEMLREEGGFKTIEAADADQALTVLEAMANVQALVTDVEMPGSSLAALVDAVRRVLHPPQVGN